MVASRLKQTKIPIVSSHGSYTHTHTHTKYKPFHTGASERSKDFLGPADPLGTNPMRVRPRVTCKKNTLN